MSDDLACQLREQGHDDLADQLDARANEPRPAIPASDVESDRLTRRIKERWADQWHHSPAFGDDTEFAREGIGDLVRGDR